MLAARMPAHDLWAGFLRDSDETLDGLMAEKRKESGKDACCRALEAWDNSTTKNTEDTRALIEPKLGELHFHSSSNSISCDSSVSWLTLPVDPGERKIYAMRLIAQRCLYGVDINPLAVEMCKLSLWLLTLAKDKPFEFLDHNIVRH